MQYSYTPHGVCSRAILIDAEDGVVNKVQFIGGCSGNTQGIAAENDKWDRASKKETLSRFLFLYAAFLVDPPFRCDVAQFDGASGGIVQHDLDVLVFAVGHQLYHKFPTRPAGCTAGTVR